MKKLSVSIGIPAYNEQDNILKLVSSLLSQTQSLWRLKEIIVISDGSTDKTAHMANSIKSPKVKIFKYSKRLGQQIRQNEILKKFKGDILVIFEADTLPFNEKTVENLVKPYLKNINSKLAMVIGQEVASDPKNFFEKIVYTWNEIKKRAFSEYQSGINLYNVHTMRAISRGFATKLLFINNVPEDSYCYLRLKELGLSMKRNKNAMVSIKTISTPQDRYAHSKKFYTGKLEIYKHFEKEFVDFEYKVPKDIFLKQIVVSFFSSPIFTVLALLEFIINITCYWPLQIKLITNRLFTVERILV